MTIIIGLGHVQAVYAIASIKAMGTALVRELLIELKIGINLEEWVVGLTYVVDQIRWEWGYWDRAPINWSGKNGCPSNIFSIWKLLRVTFSSPLMVH